MSTIIVLPALGESVSEGTITRWLKQVGDAVDEGEPLVEVSTDKVDTEIVSTASGIVESLLIDQDQTVDVGTPIAQISSQEVGAAAPAPADRGTTQRSPQTATDTSPMPSLHESRDERASNDPAASSPQGFLSPLVRRLIADHEIDVSSLAGTGRGGRIRRDDVLAAVGSDSSPVAQATLRGTTVPLSRLRRVLAAKAVESMSATAQLTTVIEVDVSRIDHLRREYKESFRARTGLGLTFLPFFAVAATEALAQHPIINARIEGDSLVYPGVENVCFAVDTEKGLYSPVVRDAADLGVEGFARAIDDVATRARGGELSPDDLTGGTFTITNTGSRGALFDTPVVFLPQVAILGTGVVSRRPVALHRDGEEYIAVRSMVYLALSYDHRAVDGADAARFLATVKGRLESGDFALS
ncbi:MAG: 2-oxo acid dehydrogenase subunit E2 [Microcella sp.]|uniref:2-oxo acid dehydrogenase subunit E2 n=1 Tax=Microcella sp. TaxID=1913979 RepID=UPI003315CB55